MKPEIKLFNTKSKSIKTFTPIVSGKVGIYSCGPTVYHHQHLGNMRAAVFADTVHRMFLSADYDVNHVINITDVGHNVTDSDDGEDKMEKGAKREGKSVWEIAKLYTDEYFSDLDLLNISLPEYTFPKATDHIEEQIALIQTLEMKGYTYKISDGIYFDTQKNSSYVTFANLDIKGLQSGARVEANPEKRNITDFALWKFSPENEIRQMEWNSPWGVGFPGWHIECSAMSMKYLGAHFDVHTGGIEHIPVHHTNEIAQSECATGKTYVNYWMHNNHLLDTTGKMSKSNEDFLTLSRLTELGYDPLAYRYFLLTANYRKELTFSFEALDGASVAYKKITTWCKENKTEGGSLSQSHMQAFFSSLYDDLGTPLCLAEIWNVIKDDTLSNDDKYKTIIAMGTTLGFPFDSLEKENTLVTEEVAHLLSERARAREAKNFEESDRLRLLIEEKGFTIKDNQGEQEVSIK